MLFIVAVLLLIAAARAAGRRLAWPQPAWLWRLPPYAIGGLASYWLVEPIVLLPMVAITLVLPNFTTRAPGPFYTGAPLAFVSVACLLLWLAFTFVQTVRHREHSLPNQPASAVPAARPSARMTAVRAARDDQLQTSINLALGSGVASIGLTVPAVSLVARWTGTPLALGVTPGGAVLLALSFMMALLT